MTHTYIFTLPVDSFFELFLAFSGLDAAFEGHTSLLLLLLLLLFVDGGGI